MHEHYKYLTACVRCNGRTSRAHADAHEGLCKACRQYLTGETTEDPADRFEPVAANHAAREAEMADDTTDDGPWDGQDLRGEDYPGEYEQDVLLAQQELEDFENHYGPLDDLRDGGGFDLGGGD